MNSGCCTEMMFRTANSGFYLCSYELETIVLSETWQIEIFGAFVV
jgi:hypothetical protein